MNPKAAKEVLLRLKSFSKSKGIADVRTRCALRSIKKSTKKSTPTLNRKALNRLGSVLTRENSRRQLATILAKWMYSVTFSCSALVYSILSVAIKK